MSRDREEHTAGKIHDRVNKFRTYVDVLNTTLEYIRYQKMSWFEKFKYRRQFGMSPEMPPSWTLTDLLYEIDTQRLSKLLKLDTIEVKQDTEE